MSTKKGFVSTYPFIMKLLSLLLKTEISAMEKYCLELYAQLEKNLLECDAFRNSTLQWIECCFQVCELSSIQLQKHRKSVQFKSEAEELNFLKIWLPKFSSLVDYYKFLYKAEIFAPQATGEAVEYWYHELESAMAFLQSHRSFHLYYKSGGNKHDQEYFLLNKPEDPFFSELIAKLIAKEKIAAYAMEKIKSLQVLSAG
jgi:hypothetical protein